MATSSIQPGLLRKMTVRRVLEVLISNGPGSRADLTRLTGISAPTVSKAVATLLEKGLAYKDYSTAEEREQEKQAAQAEKRSYNYSRRWMAESKQDEDVKPRRKKA